MAPFYHESMHLSESQVCPPDESCPLCGGKDRAKLLRIQNAPDVWLLNCRKCHVSSASRMPTEEALESYYSKFYTLAEFTREKEDKTTFDQPVRLVKHIRSAIPQSFGGRRVEILDFGGGDGTVSVVLAKALLKESACKEVRIVVVDLSEDVPREETEPIVVEKRPRMIDDGQQYDIVIASAVLEHIPYPRAVLLSLLGSLRNGGVFYARTPFHVPLLRLLPISPVRKLLFYPAHVHDMGQEFWENILAELGLSPTCRLLRSNPSVVELTFEKDFFRALASHILKAPWYILGKYYGIVGGWEVVIEKHA